MAKILVLPSEVVGELESGNSYAFPADNILMSDKTTTVEEAVNSKTGKTVVEGIDLESHTVGEGAEVYNIYTVPDVTTGGTIMNANIATGDWSHAEGRLTRAFGDCSHAEGSGNRASGNGSHAEGNSNIASGHTSHAEGAQNNSNGVSSHTEGFANTADGNYSHAEGTYTIAGSEAQHVQGKYNVEDSSGQYAHIVGWGTSTSNRKNIHTITTTGDGWFAGTVEGVAGFKIEDYLLERLNTATSGTGGSDIGSYLSLKNGDSSICSIDNKGNAKFIGKISVGTDDNEITPTSDNDLVTKKYADNNRVGKKTESGGEIFNSATDANLDAHAEGAETTASGYMSHSEGNLTTASGQISHAEGANTKAQGTGSHSEGQQTSAIGNYSHAEGVQTEANGAGAHAEGSKSNASGDYSHAEGSSVASGEASHAEGHETFSEGKYSHAEGISTIASSEAQHVQGKYNVEDSSGQYAHIIGWGTSTSNRKNINTIDTNGNGWFAGTVEGANGIKVGPSIITYNEDNQMITFNFE